MKLTIEPGALAAAVKFAARALPARAAHPILGRHVLMPIRLAG